MGERRMRFYLIVAMICFMTAAASAAEDVGRTQSVKDIYTLGSGDRVRVTVYGESDFSGEFDISGSGEIAYPLVGEVEASGKTVRELEKLVAMKLRDGYLKKTQGEYRGRQLPAVLHTGRGQAPGQLCLCRGHDDRQCRRDERRIYLPCPQGKLLRSARRCAQGQRSSRQAGRLSLSGGRYPSSRTLFLIRKCRFAFAG